jgi:Leu/Phe-tRNA-protein transferase
MSTFEYGRSLWPAHFQGLDTQQQVEIAMSICSQVPSLKRRPFAHSECDTEKLLSRIMSLKSKPTGRSLSDGDADDDGSDGSCSDDEEDGPEFCWALSFEPAFLARLAYTGFLPMSSQIFADLICLLPKFHVKRCVISNLDDLVISKNAAKKANKYEFTVDTSFDLVVEKIREQHGDHCWFYAPLTDGYRFIHDRNASGGVEGVRFHSSELWDKATGMLVAGELGYACGGIYTSLSGFRAPGTSSVGTLQCCCTGALLKRQGFAVWDLGMSFDYKKDLGAKNVSRDSFLKALRSSRGIDCVMGGSATICAKDLLATAKRKGAEEQSGVCLAEELSGGASSVPMETSMGHAAETTAGLSKNAQKKLAKIQKKQEAKAKANSEKTVNN